MAAMTEAAAVEIRRLRLFIVGVVVVVALGFAGWLLWNQQSDNGKARADDRIACVRENLTSPTTRDCG